MHNIILIGGSPTAGKTYLAQKLSQDLNMPWISTDAIRDMMRQLVDKSKYPELFKTADATADMALEVLNTYTPQEIVDVQNAESEEVWRGVKALAETDYVWGSFIVEGVAILPRQASELKIDGKDIKPIFLISTDRNKIKEVVYTRGLWDDADKYPDSVKDKEIDWVIKFNEFIQTECQKYNLPVFDVSDSEYAEKVAECSQ